MLFKNIWLLKENFLTKVISSNIYKEETGSWITIDNTLSELKYLILSNLADLPELLIYCC